MLGVSYLLIVYFQYRLLFVQHYESLYTGIIAALCCIAGIWAGVEITRKIQKKSETLPLVPPEKDHLVPDPSNLNHLNISPREHEVLVLMAKGHSNQEIAEQLFLSLNTIKTHASNIFMKLDVQRRTQAIQKAKELGLLA